MTTFTAAVLQMRSGTEPETNVAALTALVEAAVAKGATYIQSPEMTGMLCRDRATLRERLRPEASDPVLAAASGLARRHGVFLHVGSTAIALDDGQVANRAALFGPDGARLAAYDKIHMFDVDLDNGESWRESATYRPGASAALADLAMASGPVRLGFAVCYDMRFPMLFREEALAGAEVLTVPAAFTRQTGEAHWHVLLRARAIENGAFVVAAAQGGVHEDGRETYGHSIIIDPWGRVLAEIDGNEPGLALAEIDTTLVAETRRKIPNLMNTRPFEMRLFGRAAEAAE
ncbi:carbon-nitrogen hydrolase family protein [Mangrovibrevibacter kandeliae]|uniref:carbon-nitrogen hydrolase family protein n=1 Tax=Mangrovibrevibacter kandeliae TaxID=2968473 RepID=UPI00211921FC|nr:MULTISPECIES: carbon-nitrogen hydrolase family protein [unclassified Aurantimonas]MCQ8783894.1 carbon-nitrogen hydrolase family protein [Aurantimonas sp. CSK15Z-1]MCW4116613.1 carbon-nitrogen hydrolase family protein [Aurantimonas sp. MSK8Z-1]